MKKLSLLFLIFTLSFSLISCEALDKKDQDPEDDEPTTTEEELQEDVEDIEASTTADELEQELQVEPIEREPGEVPFDYPMDLSTSAKAEEFVLTTSKGSLADSFEDETGRTTMIFYHRTMIEPGQSESTIEEYSDEIKMPNSLIIPIPTGQTAEPGDIVLTWWQTGSGMTRAIIVEGGDTNQPLAKYLDLSFDYDPEKLKENSFYVISEEMQPGTAVAYKDGEEYSHEFVINVAGDKVLTSGFASILNVRNKADLIAIPIKPDIAMGDKVFIPVLGTFKEGIVIEVNDNNGRVKIEYEWAGTTSEELFPFGDIIKELP
ncbi:hypothetical protein ACFL21_03405 [Patescibacteria group bacterium]